MLRSRRESHHNDGITERDCLQQTSTTKSTQCILYRVSSLIAFVICVEFIGLGKETAALREVVLAYQIMAEVIILMGGERLLTAFLH